MRKIRDFLNSLTPTWIKALKVSAARRKVNIHTPQKICLLKDINIQNDENVFVYLLNIYIFLQNKKMEQKKLTSLREFEKNKKESHRQTRTTVLVFFLYICTRQFYPFKSFVLKRTVQKEEKK